MYEISVFLSDMSSKRPKSRVSSGTSKVKGKDKKNENNFPTPDEGAAESGHPEYIFPLVLTSATQELFGCRADEDVTGENPYKLLKKEDIIQDMKTRAAVSDFSPVKQIVLEYPEDELLLVFDRDFTYGQCFYLVLTEEAKGNMLKSPVQGDDEELVEDKEEEDMIVPKTPESHPWIPLGSEQEIEEESVTESRPRLRYKISPLMRHCGAPVCFSDRSALDGKDGYVECPSYEDKSFSIRQMERHTAVQASGDTKHSSTQTLWKYPKNMCTQYEPREFSPEEKEHHLRSENMKNFITSVAIRFEISLQQNHIADVFCDDWTALCEDDGMPTGKTETQLKEYQSFMDLHFSKEKSISHVHWHPTISGVIAVAMTERMSLEERIDNSTKLLLNPPYILFWSFTDPINPQLQLECPDDCLSFQFCPSDPNIIAGGCMNGQVVLWDISAHVERLQDTRSGGKNISNKLDKNNAVPVVRYCAVSGIENGHKAPITDIQWLPETFEVSRLGIPVENTSRISVQIVTCAPDCCVLFWDLRPPRAVSQSLTDVKQKSEDKPLENPQGVPNTFKHLNLTWKPLIRVSLPKIGSSGEYSPLKFSLRDNTVDYITGDKPAQITEREEGCGFAQLRVPSAKEQKPLDNISTKLYVGTEDGELVYTDWKMEKDNDSGRLFSAKPSHRFLSHHTMINTVSRSPFFKDIILTVGSFSFAIWKEGVTSGPILLSACSKMMCTVGHWSLSRPAVFFIGKENGNIEVWDLLQNTHEPSQTQNISATSITCIKTSSTSAKHHLLAVSDRIGTLHILQIPWTLRKSSNSERQNVRKYFEKEEERLEYFEKRQIKHEKQKKEMEAEQLKKKTEPVIPLKQVEELEAEALKEYEQFLALGKDILKNMGLLTETQDDSDL
ncbi:dynein axonemal intermediate chain 3 isoform X1 [Megalobrama amblycephala]|uniref:dynein axonemal intermediate chain 3 isoform X1 n=2 Tax=Megalobrama amblycephala TaxID=75352 RepID=UPI0020147FDA|nr:dynein axonemal intermediate chain 3 isoform X1 [Megalobrama amblycephala]